MAAIDPGDLIDYNTNQVNLERLKIEISTVIAKHLFDVEVKSIDWDDYINQIELTITGYFYGENRDHFELSYPASWWEAVKDRFMPTFLRRFIPVRYTTWEVNCRVIYPEYYQEFQENQGKSNLIKAPFLDIKRTN